MKIINIKNTTAFTLVELIIVITLLAILATIAFMSFQSYVKQSRDTHRVTTLTNIEKGLDLFYIKTATYPTPDSLTGSGYLNNQENILVHVGTVGNNISQLLSINKIPTDPITGNGFMYGTSLDNRYYQIGTVFESQLSSTSFLMKQTYADYMYKAKVIGNFNGVLEYKNGNNMCISNIPSLIFASGGLVNLSGEDIGFIVNNKQNLPYTIGTVTEKIIQPTSEILRAISFTSQIINDCRTMDLWENNIINPTTRKMIEEQVGYPIDIIGKKIFGEKSYEGFKKDYNISTTMPTLDEYFAQGGGSIQGGGGGGESPDDGADMILTVGESLDNPGVRYGYTQNSFGNLSNNIFNEYQISQLFFEKNYWSYGEGEDFQEGTDYSISFSANTDFLKIKSMSFGDINLDLSDANISSDGGSLVVNFYLGSLTTQQQEDLNAIQVGDQIPISFVEIPEYIGNLNLGNWAATTYNGGESFVYKYNYEGFINTQLWNEYNLGNTQFDINLVDNYGAFSIEELYDGIKLVAIFSLHNMENNGNGEPESFHEEEYDNLRIYFLVPNTIDIGKTLKSITISGVELEVVNNIGYSDYFSHYQLRSIEINKSNLPEGLTGPLSPGNIIFNFGYFEFKMES